MVGLPHRLRIALKAAGHWRPLLAGPCPSLTADKQATGRRPAIDCKRVDEKHDSFFHLLWQ